MDTAKWIPLGVLLAVGVVNGGSVRRSTPVVFPDSSIECDSSYQIKIVCYISASNQNYNYDSLGPGLCTHFILIDLVGVNGEGKLLLMQRSSRALTQFTEFRDRIQQSGDPALFIIAIGGVNQKSTQFSKAVNCSTQRTELVNNIVTFAKKHTLDGIDIAWFYPGQFGGRRADKTNLVLFLQLLHLRMQVCGMSVSLTVGVDPRDIEISYDVKQIDMFVDFVNLLAGDYHDPRKPSHVSPLYPSDPADRLNIDYSVRSFIDAGLNPQKIVILTSTYAYLYTVKLCINGGQATVKSIQKLSKLGAQEIIERENFYTSWDDARMVPYATLTHGLNKKWITFNDIESHRRKAEYVVKKQIGGIGAYTIDMDDHDGFCSGIPYPFLWTLVNVFGQKFTYEEYPQLIDDDVPVHYVKQEPPCNTCGVRNSHKTNTGLEPYSGIGDVPYKPSYKGGVGGGADCVVPDVTEPPAPPTVTVTID